ncbi:MAG: 7-cyano-7-deazaguanine synthase QueC [Puniceicoccaceae bacterium]
MKTLVVFSGGLDSTVLLYHLLAEGKQVSSLSVDYGQRHQVELSRARMIAENAGVPWDCVDFSTLGSLLGKSSLVDRSVEVPEGHYEDESMKLTVVPNRNMILIALATARAIAIGANEVAYGAHAGDHAIYPDCRPAFAEAMDAAVRLADFNEVRLYRPFIGLSKAEIVTRGAELGVPFEDTWSCYKGGAVHCGRCGTCVERREAFQIAGVPDPTPYAEGAPDLSELLAQRTVA